MTMGEAAMRRWVAQQAEVNRNGRVVEMAIKTGLEPRDFCWVIKDRLAVSARIGGQGYQHRRVRREEEISWLVKAGFTAVVSLLAGAQNVKNYEDAGLTVHRAPVGRDPEPEEVERVFTVIGEALAPPDARVLVHRDYVDDTVAGLLAGYLVFSGMLDDPRLAVIAVEEAVGSPMGPAARALIPPPG